MATFNLMALPIAFMLAFIVVEMLVLQWQKRQEFTWKDTILNLNSGHVVLWLFRGVEVFVFYWIGQHWSLNIISQWPVWIQWAFAFVMWDFCFYVLHYMHHKIGLLWALHRVHHEGRYFNVSLGARNSWYSSLSSIPFFVWMAFLGLPVEIFIVVSTMHYAIQLFNHNALTPRLGILEYFMVTPTHHKVHHGQDEIYRDSNYGGSFIVWDKLFGTFQMERAGKPLVMGIGEQPASQNPLHTNHDVLRRWLKKKIPIRPSARFNAPEWLIALAGVALFLVVILYVAGDGIWPQWQFYTLFGILFLATLAIGGLSEGRPWGVWCWLGTTVALAVVVLGVFGWLHWYWLLLTSLLVVHSLATLVILRPQLNNT